MSPIIKKPQHRGKAPFLSVLAAYLAAEEGREACLLLDAEGNRITPEALTRDFGGDHAEHWHAIVSPTPEDCRIALERHGGDVEAAGTALGREMAQRLERDTGRRVAFAVHIGERAGQTHFHFHVVGMGEPKVRLYGRSGVIQRAWDRAWRPDERPIVNWQEHAAFLKTRQELRVVQKQLRDLGQERYRALAVAPPGEKAAVREAFKVRELDLIPQRYELEVKAIDHRYAAREDSGSTRHQAELVDAANRQTGAVTRANRRGQPWEVLRGERGAGCVVGLTRSVAAPIRQGVKGALRSVEKAFTVSPGGTGARADPAPVAQPHELAQAAATAAAKAAALTTARIAARTVEGLALKAVSANPPGLVIQAARIAVNLPGKVLDLVVQEKARLPPELAVPLRALSAVPGLEVAAKVAAVTTKETLKPIHKETER